VTITTLVWVAVALALIAWELHHLALFALFGALGAAAAALVSLIARDAIGVQLFVGFVVTAIGVVLLRPYVSRALPRHLHGRVAVGVHGGLVGERVVALDAVTGDPGGHVRLAGETWLAVTTDRATVLAPGTSAIVKSVHRTTLHVCPEHPLDPTGSTRGEG
jgi:membrane protein implicated in regulation of membrane protease activity